MYKKLKNEIDLITNGVDNQSPEIEKFLEIYKRLGNKISYDWEHKDVDSDEEKGTIYLGGYPAAHNLEGGLLNNTCVCEGYSKILKQALACVGIKSKVILGNEQTEPHAWNQVNIDGIWYNTDLTWDEDKIKEGRQLDYCLQSDSEFMNHTTESSIAEQCNNSYDRNKINQYLGIPFAFDFEEKNYSVADSISLIQDVNNYAINGTRIGINKDFSTGDYKLLLGNIMGDDTVKWSENEIALTSDNLAEFIKQYAKTFQVNGRETFGTVDFIKTNESIELVIDENLKLSLKDYEIDIDEVLRPKEKNNSLIEYKPSIWSKIINSLKNGWESIQKSLFKNKKIDIPSTEQEQTSKNTKKLPSWDLRNWSKEELEFYAVQGQRGQTTKDESVKEEENVL